MLICGKPVGVRLVVSDRRDALFRRANVRNEESSRTLVSADELNADVARQCHRVGDFMAQIAAQITCPDLFLDVPKLARDTWARFRRFVDNRIEVLAEHAVHVNRKRTGCICVAEVGRSQQELVSNLVYEPIDRRENSLG